MKIIKEIWIDGFKVEKGDWTDFSIKGRTRFIKHEGMYKVIN